MRVRGGEGARRIDGAGSDGNKKGNEIGGGRFWSFFFVCLFVVLTLQTWGGYFFSFFAVLKDCFQSVLDEQKK